MLLNRLNELASVHFEQILCHWHFICGAHTRHMYVGATNGLLRFDNLLYFVVPLLELSLKLIQLVGNRLLDLLPVDVPGLGQVLVQVFMAHRVLYPTAIDPDAFII